MIRSRRSDFDVLLSNLPALTTHLVELADHFIKSSATKMCARSRPLSKTFALQANTCRAPCAKFSCSWRTFGAHREVQGTMLELRSVIAGLARCESGGCKYPADHGKFASTTQRLNSS